MTHAQGNWGNALMAYGSLKRRYLEALQEGPPPQTREDATALRASEAQLLGARTLSLLNPTYLAVALPLQSGQSRHCSLSHSPSISPCM